MILTLNENGYIEDYLQDTPVHHFEESLTLEECMMIAIEEADRTWNEMMQGIALEEIRELSEGVEALNEGKISDLIDKFVAWVKRAWEYISGQFEKFMAWIREKLSGDKRFIKKYKEKILKASIPADGLDIGKWYDFSRIIEVVDGVTGKTDAMMQRGMDMLRHIREDISIDDYDSSIDIVIDKICKIGTGDNETTASSYMKDLKKALTGEEHTGNIPAASINKARVVEDIEKSQEVMNAVRKSYNQCKKVTNAFIKACKKAKSSADSEQEAKKIAKAITFAKKLVKLLTKEKSATLSALKAYSKQNKAIGRKLAGLATDGGKKEETKNESFQFDSNLDDFFSTSFC